MIDIWNTDGKRYSLIYADPPWPYNSRSAHKKTKFGGGVHSNYAVMTLDGMKNLPIKAMSDDNCWLAMWVTGPHMHNAKPLMEAWGFRYVETLLFVWVKTNPRKKTPFYGPGFYTGSNCEMVMLGKRGKPTISKRGVSQIVLEPHPRDDAGRIIHSRKPDCVRDRLVTLFGDVPRIELFARQRADGWDAIGDQLN
jgi:N6-adenosine-specific RNA methylase IME4